MLVNNAVFVASAFICAQAATYKSLEEVYGPVAPVLEMRPIGEQIAFANRSQVSDEYLALRDPEECIFPIEIVILQDLTASFEDDVENMKTGIREMAAALHETHPGTTVSIISFKDKPIWPLGTSGDYCVKVELKLTDDLEAMTDVFDNMSVYGGGDMPEAQFHALLAACSSSKIGWNNNLASRIIVVITDAAPHFAGDGFNTMNLPDFVPPFNDADPAAQCEQQYYPSPDHVDQALNDRAAYLGSLVHGTDYQNGIVGKSWQWVNSKVGQLEGFYQEINADSSNFWPQLEKIIKILEDIECGRTSTTSAPPQTPAATGESHATPAATGEVISTELHTPAATGGAETATDGEVPPTVTAMLTDATLTFSEPHTCGECPTCPAFGCMCCCNGSYCAAFSGKVPKRLFLRIEN